VEETREAFFKQCQELGVQPEEAVSILKRNHINERYTPENHKKYLGIITSHAKGLEKLLRIANHLPDNFIPLDNCPVCGMSVERDYDRDGSLRAQHGWKCSNPEQVPVSHFIWARLERIRPWMQRNQGMSDPETSSEMAPWTEYPSGDSPAPSFSEAYSDAREEAIGQRETRDITLSSSILISSEV
jgi:hypothetical protein